MNESTILRLRPSRRELSSARLDDSNERSRKRRSLRRWGPEPLRCGAQMQRRPYRRVCCYL